MGCKCGGAVSNSNQGVIYSVMGNYKYLSRGQINKRLEVFKRIYCIECNDRGVCTIDKYTVCTIRPEG